MSVESLTRLPGVALGFAVIVGALHVGSSHAQTQTDPCRTAQIKVHGLQNAVYEAGKQYQFARETYATVQSEFRRAKHQVERNNCDYENRGTPQCVQLIAQYNKRLADYRMMTQALSREEARYQKARAPYDRAVAQANAACAGTMAEGVGRGAGSAGMDPIKRQILEGVASEAIGSLLGGGRRGVGASRGGSGGCPPGQVRSEPGKPCHVPGAYRRR